MATKKEKEKVVLAHLRPLYTGSQGGKPKVSIRRHALKIPEGKTAESFFGELRDGSWGSTWLETARGSLINSHWIEWLTLDG